MINLIGQKFNKLTILERHGSTQQQKALWRCRCDCGNIVITTTGVLKSGKTKSCGCLRKITAQRLGLSRRKINYNNIQCHICGKSLSYRFLNSDGSLKRPLCEKKINSLVCKPCHKLISKKNGHKVADLNSNIPISNLQIEIILGSILGDGHLEKSPAGKLSNYGLSVKHGLQQEKYCLWKASLLGDLITKIDYPRNRIRFRTKKHKLIRNIAKQFMVNGRKTITYDAIKNIGPIGLLIWYLDDGSLLPYRISKKGKTRKPEIRFSTNCFTDEENLIIRKVLKERMDIESTKCSWKATRNFRGEKLKEPKRYYGIRLYGKNAEKFIDFVRPHADLNKSGMAYKFDLTLRGPLDNKHTRPRIN